MNLTRSNVSNKFILTLNYEEIELIGLALQHLRDSDTWNDSGKSVDVYLRTHAATVVALMWEAQQPLMTQEELESDRVTEEMEREDVNNDEEAV